MSGRLHCLNAGKADCFVIELEENGEKTVLLIDGGSKNEPVMPLLPYLEAHSIRQIDLLALTHLHQDHQGYLGDVAAVLPVRRALLPYPPIPLTEDDLAGVVEEERRNDVAVFNRMWADLLRQGCRVETAFPLTAAPFVFGSWRLSCIFPTVKDTSPVYEALCRMRDRSSHEAHDLYESVRLRFNGDSSILLLEHEGKPSALLCGDSFHTSLLRALAGRTPAVSLIKLSHHGRNDKGNLYFVRNFLQTLSPQTLVITSSRALALQHRAEWENICPTACLIVTGEANGAEILPLA